LADDARAGGGFFGFEGGDVHADDLAGGEAGFEDAGNCLGGIAGATGIIGFHVGAEVERNGDAGETQKCGFDGGGDGAAVDDVDAGVGAAVHAADDEVGGAGKELGDGEFNTIGGAAFDGGAGEGVGDGHSASEEGNGEGDAVPGGALNGGGGDDVNFADFDELLIESDKAWSGNPVVVGQKNEHGGSIMGVMVRLTREQVRRIDKISIEEYHIPGIVLMENAAIAAANVAVQMVSAGLVMVICGGGNNGGDGLAIARHLHNRGYEAAVFLTTDPAKYVGDAKINWEIVRAMKLRVEEGMPEIIAGQRAKLVVDAIFGTGLTQMPRDPFPKIVEAIEKIGAPVLAIDIPSGLDCDTGRPLGPACVRAARTITFVAEKAGFGVSEAREYLGEVIVGDIGCPRELIGLE
jgi:NAD(P)H-hydrate epimerase